MKKIVFLLSTLASLTPFFATADCSGYGCYNERITRLYVQAWGDVLIMTSGDESKLQCDAGSDNYIKLEAGVTNFESIYSLLLVAHTTGERLRIRTTTEGECRVSYVVSDKLPLND